MSLFLRMGGHHVRLIVGLDQFLDIHYHVIVGDPPPGADAANEELRDLMYEGYCRTNRSNKKGPQKYLLLLITFFSIVNGPPSDNGFFFYTRGPVDMVALKSTLKRCVLGIFLKSQPSTPSLAKWTKLNPCLRFFAVGNLWRFLRNLFLISFAVLAIKISKLRANFQGQTQLENLGAGGGMQVDVDAKTEAEWHKVCGARYARGERVLSCPIENFIFLVLTIILEPIEIMTHYFMMVSNQKPTYDKWPPLLDLLWWPTSLVNWVLQYYSQLLAGDPCTRLNVILASCGVATLAGLQEAYPERVYYLRNITFMVIGLIEIRHVAELESDPLHAMPLPIGGGLAQNWIRWPGIAKPKTIVAPNHVWAKLCTTKPSNNFDDKLLLLLGFFSQHGQNLSPCL
jgi:hypothetical protein